MFLKQKKKYIGKLPEQLTNVLNHGYAKANPTISSELDLLDVVDVEINYTKKF